MKKVLVPLADGFEEIEAVTIIDILRRAGAYVTSAGLKGRNVEGSHGIKMIADSILNDELEKEWDLIVLPGGVPGAPNLSNDKRIIHLLKTTAARKKIVAAICAAPSVLEKAGIITGKKVTSHPAWTDKINSAIHTNSRVEVDKKIVPGQAVGSAMEFAFKLVELLFSKKTGESINQTVIANI